MIVKVYKYKIKKTDFNKWKKVNDSARKLYKKYGGGNSRRLFKKSGIFIEIIEMDYYNSKKAFLNINKKVEDSPKIHILFKEFISYVHNTKIVREEFNSI